MISNPIVYASIIDDPPAQYYITSYWDKDTNYDFYFQVSNVSCIPASALMLLNSYHTNSAPSQQELAVEMNSDINHTVVWNYLIIPFEKRDFKNIFNGTLSENPDYAIYYLKQHIVQNHGIIVKTWYNESVKEKNLVTHARVVTGYNQTGIFFHDPLKGPDRYMNYNQFISLWNVNGEYWVFLIENRIPQSIDIVYWIGQNLDVMVLLLIGVLVETHYVSRISMFSNCIALIIYVTKYELGSLVIGVYVILGLVLGIVGLISYAVDESLPQEYYAITFILYNSLLVGVIMIFISI
ncbi:MAG: C39 family peptidase [Candidatus Bathyarchaeia archaeon]